mmetsp:Transcript_9412/g.24110  ORF Transcript_9412/g.24110 Transcript_9412/m.24110 type:complete len:337 (+) Transcript_9412:202-1212(+)
MPPPIGQHAIDVRGRLRKTWATQQHARDRAAPPVGSLEVRVARVGRDDLDARVARRQHGGRVAARLMADDTAVDAAVVEPARRRRVARVGAHVGEGERICFGFLQLFGPHARRCLGSDGAAVAVGVRYDRAPPHRLPVLQRDQRLPTPGLPWCVPLRVRRMILEAAQQEGIHLRRPLAHALDDAHRRWRLGQFKGRPVRRNDAARQRVDGAVDEESVAEDDGDLRALEVRAHRAARQHVAAHRLHDLVVGDRRGVTALDQRHLLSPQRKRLRAAERVEVVVAEALGLGVELLRRRRARLRRQLLQVLLQSGRVRVPVRPRDRRVVASEVDGPELGR